MRLDAAKIPSSQLLFLTIGFTIGSSVVISPGSNAGKDAWLATIAGLAEGLLIVLIQLAFALRFPGKNLIEIIEIIYGRYFGKVIALAYLWFFTQLAGIVLRDFTDFFSGVVYPETPIIAIGFSLMLFSYWAVRSGIEVIARISIVIVTIFILIIILNVTISIKDFEFTNLLPVLDIPAEKFLKASHGVATFPFAEFIVFTMILGNINKINEIRATVVKGMSIACLVLVIILIRNISVLGPYALIATYPTYVAVRMIDIAQITRLEVLVAVNLITMGFLKISVLYYAAVVGTAELFKLRSYRQLVLIFGILIIAINTYVYDNFVGTIIYTNEVWPYFSLIFKLFLPLVSLIVAVARRLPRRHECQCT